MSELSTNNIQHLLQEGRAAALAGDTMAARASFRQATELDPSCAAAWLGLSGVVPILADKQTYLQRVLTLDPDNAEAQASLRYVEKLLAEGLQLAPSGRSTESAPAATSAPATTATEYCYLHPDRETGLRCIQCNRPICGSCAFTTPVGQLCPECRRGRRPLNYQVSVSNLIVGGAVAFIASTLVAIPLALFARGFFSLIIIFMIGPAIAEFIVRVVDRVTRLKRGRPMQIVVGVAMTLGVLAVLFVLPNLLLLLYLAVGIATIVARLR